MIYEVKTTHKLLGNKKVYYFTKRAEKEIFLLGECAFDYKDEPAILSPFESVVMTCQRKGYLSNI